MRNGDERTRLESEAPDEAAIQGKRFGGELLNAELYWRSEEGRHLGSLFWEAGPGWRMAASGVLGGGLGNRSFVLNSQVSGAYGRTDPQNHVAEIATGITRRAGASGGSAGNCVGLLTAAEVSAAKFASDGGVEALVTVGLGRPIWAADSPHLDAARLEYGAVLGAAGYVPGTVNIIVAVPAPLSDAALINTVATATEAKVQALMEAGFACTGTASDAICVASRTDAGPGIEGSERDEFGGPRSRWGARIARAVFAAICEGAVNDS